MSTTSSGIHSIRGSPIDGSTLKYRNLEDNRAFRLSLTVSNSNDLHAWYQDGEINEADQVSPQLNINTKNSTFESLPVTRCADGMDNLSLHRVRIAYHRGNRADTQEFWGPQGINDAGQPDQYIVELGNEQVLPV